MPRERSYLKMVADALTASRLVIALIVIAASFVGSPRDHLSWVVPLVVLGWTGDLLDGWLARRSGRAGTSWLGKQDLVIDVILATSALIYLTRLGWLSPYVLAAYLGLVLLLALLLRTRWVWNGFNTGSHLIALSSILQIVPGLGQLVLAWLTVVAVLGRKRLAQMLGEARNALLRWSRAHTRP